MNKSIIGLPNLTDLKYHVARVDKFQYLAVSSGIGKSAKGSFIINHQSNHDDAQVLLLRAEHTITITVIIFCTVSITVGVNIIVTLCRYNKMEVLVIFSSPSVHERGLTLGVQMGRLWSRNWL